MSVCNGQNYFVCQYSPPGNWNVDTPGVLWGFAVFVATQQRASDLAFNGCGGAKNGCKTFWTTRDKCVAFAESRQNGYWYAASGGTNQQQATTNAVKYCQSGTAPKGSCKAVRNWCR
jgi:hypothetical protein